MKSFLCQQSVSGYMTPVGSEMAALSEMRRVSTVLLLPVSHLFHALCRFGHKDAHICLLFILCSGPFQFAKCANFVENYPWPSPYLQYIETMWKVWGQVNDFTLKLTCILVLYMLPFLPVPPQALMFGLWVGDMDLQSINPWMLSIAAYLLQSICKNFQCSYSWHFHDLREKWIIVLVLPKHSLSLIKIVWNWASQTGLTHSDACIV